MLGRPGSSARTLTAGCGGRQVWRHWPGSVRRARQQPRVSAAGAAVAAAPPPPCGHWRARGAARPSRAPIGGARRPAGAASGLAGRLRGCAAGTALHGPLVQPRSRPPRLPRYSCYPRLPRRPKSAGRCAASGGASPCSRIVCLPLPIHREVPMFSVFCRALAGLGLGGRSAVLEAGIVDVNQHRVKDWAMWCSGRSAKASPSLSLPLALEQPEAGTAERRSHKPALEQPQPKTLEHRHDPEVSRNLVSRYAPSSVNL